MSTEAPQSRARLQFLQQIERNAQQAWAHHRVFEQDPISSSSSSSKNETYFATFPYPYMNGILHLGHAFTILKADFQVAYQRLKGKTALFPFGFHCTGMPIQAAADKLRREIQAYGLPPVFPTSSFSSSSSSSPAVEDDDDESASISSSPSPSPSPSTATITTTTSTTTTTTTSTTSAASSATTVKKSKKSKVAAKTGNVVYQWNIMKDLGISESEIQKFTDPKYWLGYFPPIAVDNLKAFGVCVDFRRSFITTAVNPYYDTFIRWQFNVLRAQQKIAFGNRPCIFSPIDNQACADHDRAEGEGVGITDYTLIKMRLQQPYPAALSKLLGSQYSSSDYSVILPAATLRPETMYGQTNAWMLPDGEYGLFLMNNNELFVCAPRSALNMSYQLLCAERGKPQQLGTILGREFMGCAVKSPNATFDVIYILPLLTIKMDKGTGVVTSVPSDAPDDYAALMDCKNKPALRAKFGISDECVMKFDVVPIIETPGLGSTPAPTLCQQMNVTSQNDRIKLDEIKDKVYKEGFAKGIMMVGPQKGQRVAEAKSLIKAQLTKDGLAAPYSEPESRVVSRSGNECVVAFTDQWYLKYGEAEWQSLVRNHINDTLQTFYELAKSKFQFSIEWLHEWACSRSYGLGTQLPWDTQYVIESLSDSTIYMAYYTISHMLQSNLEGSKPGSANIQPHQLTDDVFDYVFKRSDVLPTSSTIPPSTVQQMRREFEFWYPMNLRVSGKDLIPNHLTMSLYNHVAVWPNQPDLWPRAFYTNGHVMVEAEKMSKSKGNFITLPKAIDEWGADATRFALADAGDGMEDSNFEKKTANAAILRLTKEEMFVKEVVASFKSTSSSSTSTSSSSPSSSYLKLRSGAYNFWDEVFLNDINSAIISTDQAYAVMRYRDALKFSCYDLHIARDNYRLACDVMDAPMHGELIMNYIRVSTLLLSPICPHYSQHIWSEYGFATTSDPFIHRTAWPLPSSSTLNALLSRQAEYLRDHTIHLRAAKQDALNLKEKAKKKGKADSTAPADYNALIIFIARQYPDWQQWILRLLKQLVDDAASLSSSSPSPSFVFDRKVLTDKLKEQFGSDKKRFQDAMKFSTETIENFNAHGITALETNVPFDELQLTNEHLQFLIRGLQLSSYRVMLKEEVDTLSGIDAKAQAEKAVPGRPSCIFYSV